MLQNKKGLHVVEQLQKNKALDVVNYGRLCGRTQYFLKDKLVSTKTSYSFFEAMNASTNSYDHGPYVLERSQDVVKMMLARINQKDEARIMLNNNIPNI